MQLGGESREQLIRGRQGRMLLAYLVLNRRRPVPRDRLVQALWAQDAAPPSDSALSPVLSRLRRALAPAEIDGRTGIVLRLPEPVWVDVEVAEAALARARDTGQPAQRLAAAREAAELLEPGLLPGHDAEWLREARDATERVRVEALEVAAATAKAPNPALAEELARQAVAAAPFRESAWVALIDAPPGARQSRRGAAGLRGDPPAAARRARHGSRTRAAGDPQPATGRRRGAAARPNRTAPTAVAGPGHAPPSRRGATADLVEREDELAAVDGALDRALRGRGGVVLFEGPAGIGKTRLLAELRHGAEQRRAAGARGPGQRARARVRLRRRPAAARAGGRGADGGRGRRGARGPDRARDRRRHLPRSSTACSGWSNGWPETSRWRCVSTTCSGAIPRRCGSRRIWPGGSPGCPRSWPRPSAPASRTLTRRCLPSSPRSRRRSRSALAR